MTIRNIVVYSKNLPPDNVGGIETFALNFIRLLSESGHYNILTITQTKKKLFFKRRSELPWDNGAAPVLVLKKNELRKGEKLLSTIAGASFKPEETLIFYNTLDLHERFQEFKELGFRQVARSGGNDIFFMQRRDGKGGALLKHLSSLDKLILNSDYSRRRAVDIGLPCEQLQVIKGGCAAGQNGAISRRLLGIDDDCVVLMTAGRMVDFKGLDDALNAIALVKENIERFVYLLIGDGELRDQLQRKCETLGLADCVRFMGIQPPAVVDSFYGVADIYLSTSIEIPKQREGFPYIHTETMGRSICEAQAHGLPVVATRAGGVPEMLVDGETGLLVDAGDSAAIANALERLIVNAELRAWLGTNAKRFAQAEFSWEAVFAAWEECLAEIDKSG